MDVSRCAAVPEIYVFATNILDVVRSHLMLIWTFAFAHFEKIFASIWHANEDYDHKRKLVTISAYLLYLLLFIHHENYESSLPHI